MVNGGFQATYLQGRLPGTGRQRSLQLIGKFGDAPFLPPRDSAFSCNYFRFVEMECKPARINAGSVAVNAGLRRAIVAVISGLKWL